MQVHQFVESITPGDAISNHAIEIQHMMRSHGITSELYVHHATRDMEHIAYLFSEYESKDPETVLLFHYSIYSDAFRFFSMIPRVTKGMIFHNVTPPEYFPKGDPFRKSHIEAAYKQMWNFNEVFDFAIADSTYNKTVLRQHNFMKSITVIPPVINLDTKFGSYIKKLKKNNKHRKPSRTKNRKKIICISQILHHKKQDDVIKVFDIYNRFFNRESDLYIIGGYYASDFYQHVEVLAKRNTNVHLTGKISQEDLTSHLMTADCALYLSEHEGFAVPVVEAMYFGLPVIAYNAGAVAETMGSGGILIDSKDFFAIAEILNHLLETPSLAKEISTSQKEELTRFDHKLLESHILTCLTKNTALHL